MNKSLLDEKGDDVDMGRRLEVGLPGEQGSINKVKNE